MEDLKKAKTLNMRESCRQGCADCATAVRYDVVAVDTDVPGDQLPWWHSLVLALVT